MGIKPEIEGRMDGAILDVVSPFLSLNINT